MCIECIDIMQIDEVKNHQLKGSNFFLMLNSLLKVLYEKFLSNMHTFVAVMVSFHTVTSFFVN